MKIHNLSKIVVLCSFFLFQNLACSGQTSKVQTNETNKNISSQNPTENENQKPTDPADSVVSPDPNKPQPPPPTSPPSTPTEPPVAKMNTLISCETSADETPEQQVHTTNYNSKSSFSDTWTFLNNLNQNNKILSSQIISVNGPKLTLLGIEKVGSSNGADSQCRMSVSILNTPDVGTLGTSQSLLSFPCPVPAPNIIKFRNSNISLYKGKLDYLKVSQTGNYFVSPSTDVSKFEIHFLDNFKNKIDVNLNPRQYALANISEDGKYIAFFDFRYFDKLYLAIFDTVKKEITEVEASSVTFAQLSPYFYKDHLFWIERTNSEVLLMEMNLLNKSTKSITTIHDIENFNMIIRPSNNNSLNVFLVNQKRDNEDTEYLYYLNLESTTSKNYKLSKETKKYEIPKVVRAQLNATPSRNRFLLNYFIYSKGQNQIVFEQGNMTGFLYFDLNKKEFAAKFSQDRCFNIKLFDY